MKPVTCRLIPGCKFGCAYLKQEDTEQAGMGEVVARLPTVLVGYW